MPCKYKSISSQVIQKTSNIVCIQTALCTIIAAYFQPEYKEEEIIGEITAVMTLISRKETVILAGDLNCRIDIRQPKAEQVIRFIEGEGLTLANKAEEKTYVCHNGSSTIDLVFTNTYQPLQRVMTT